jgi:hypothetical protein
MASRESIAVRRSQALDRIDNVVRQINTPFSPQAVPAKDPELADVVRLENAAAALEAIGQQAGLRVGQQTGGPGVPKDHRRSAGAPFINEYVAPKPGARAAPVQAEEPPPTEETAAADADDGDDEPAASASHHAKTGAHGGHTKK